MGNRKEKNGLKWRTRTIQIRVPVCPECGADMEESKEGRKYNVFQYICPKCYYKH